jgi:hypothetical protein
MRTPDFSGVAGWRAWTVKNTLAKPDHAASVASYLLFCPGAHPLWSYWNLGVVHLRPLPGVRPAIITRPGATHEILMAALDPDTTPDPDDVGEGWPWLRPFDLVEQFQVPGDEYARQLARLMVEMIMHGNSPDSDYRRSWQNVVQATAAHYREGRHPIQ